MGGAATLSTCMLPILLPALAAADEWVDDTVAPLVRRHPQAALTIGLFGPQGEVLRGYGTRMGKGSAAPDPAGSWFEIGSVTKTYVSAALSVLVSQGLLSWDAPVSGLLQDAGHWPAWITLHRLVTHTAGLPTLPDNFQQSAKKEPANPYANYTAEALTIWIRGYRPDAEAPATRRFIYSNVGFGVLGRVLERQTGIEFEAALRSLVLAPLGLELTGITDRETRLIQPRLPDGTPTPAWDIPNLPGAGALRSTAADQLRFLRAQLDTGSPLSAALAAMRSTEVAAQDAPGPLTHGWLKMSSPGGVPLFLYSGSTYGSGAILAFSETAKLGIAVLRGVGGDMQKPGPLEVAFTLIDGVAAGRPLG